MQTMKNTVNPAMLKQLANIPPAPPRKERDEPIRPGRMAPVAEDVHMRTVKHEPVMEKPKGLEEWEKRLVESADSKRKATVAQLCESLLEYSEIALTVQTSWSTTVRGNEQFPFCLRMLIISRSTRIHLEPKEETRDIQGRHRRATGQLAFSHGLHELISGIRPRIRKRGPIIQWPRTCPPPKKTYKAPSGAI